MVVGSYFESAVQTVLGGNMVWLVTGGGVEYYDLRVIRDFEIVE